MLSCHEIPETVCVETRFIKAEVAKQMNKEKLLYITRKNGILELTRHETQEPLLNYSRNITKPPTINIIMPANPSSSIQQSAAGNMVSLKSLTPLANQNMELIIDKTNNIPCEINSTVSLPLQNSSQQNTILHLNTSCVPATTNISNAIRTYNEEVQHIEMKSVGIQCSVDEDIDDLEIEWLTTTEESPENEGNTNVEVQTFLKFIHDNSTQHKIFRECLICGEVCKSNKYFYGHMKVHLGPKVLCCKCGKYLENERLLQKHICRKAQQLQNAFLQCPFPNCSVKTISRLELYDHINEHSSDLVYKCSACNKGFCTSQEFRRHLLIRGKCYTSAKRKRIYDLNLPMDRLCRVRVFTLHTFKKQTILVKSFLSQRSPKNGLCMLCMRSFANKWVFRRHRGRCAAKFRNRLIRKRRQAAKI